MKKQQTQRRSCNRHADCDEAEARFRQQHPNGKFVAPYTVVYLPDHCHDEACEECFGC